MRTFLEQSDRVLILDGAMGTMLQKQGLLSASVPEAINLHNPRAVTDIHRQYIESGAQLIYANTFGVNRYKLQNSGYDVAELIEAGIFCAKQAARQYNPDVKVALDCTSIGRMLEPSGDMRLQEAYDIFREVVVAGKEADCIVFETFTDLLELKSAILAARENTELPIMASMTFETTGRTFEGAAVESVALTLSGLGVQAIGINCSLGPEQILPLAEQMSRWTHLPLLIKPNAGLPDPATHQYALTPEQFANVTHRFTDYGAGFIGGCCGTTPEFIAALRDKLAGKTRVNTHYAPQTAVCSAQRSVPIDQVRIVGERINPTGKKRFKEALKTGQIDYIVQQALEQSQAGAEVLDVNVGIPDIDEPAMMTRVVQAVQSVCDTPLQVDSSDPNAIEAALRVYSGKALVNSVNAKDSSLHEILPIVKKYGAAVIGLTLDEKGLPQTAEERVQIAKKIVQTAQSYGIAKHDIVIDCLTLTASAQQDQAMETLEALRRVKQELGVKTTLGVSNVSFGLPDRETINASFLTLAMGAGLDLPIINPNNSVMLGAVQAFRVLANLDKNAASYIRDRSALPTTEKPRADKNEEVSLSYAIQNGLRAAAAQATKRLLMHMKPSEIIDTMLIETLERVGDSFEKGHIFLPQLMQAATAAQASFEVIKETLVKQPTPEHELQKGTIVLATVKGDIHDIGKNIVKVVLENSGYHVVDLGRDVSAEAIAEATEQHRAGLVGLSALMTTTVKSMQEAIVKLRQVSSCKIMVGGAVLTNSYAMSIGADYYGKDAKAAMDIAKGVFR